MISEESSESSRTMVFEKLLIFMEEMKRKEKEDDGIKRAIIKSKKEPSINLLADLRSKKINFFTIKKSIKLNFSRIFKNLYFKNAKEEEEEEEEKI